MKIESEFKNYSISVDGQFRAYFEDIYGVFYIQIEVYRNKEWVKSYRFESPILASRLVWPEQKIGSSGIPVV
jgi:hypothetical protein